MHATSQLILDKTIGIYSTDMRGDHMFDYRLCLGAMLHVQQNMSASYYNFLHINRPEAFEREISDEVDLLDKCIGICGIHVNAFSVILEELGYKTREVQVFHALEGTDIIQGHVIAEVFFGEAWRMFDVTWGWHPYSENTEKVMSFEQTQTEPFSKCMNGLDPWTNNTLQNSEDAVWRYMQRQDYGVLYAREGLITPPFDVGTKKYTIDGLPNHIGWTKSFCGQDGHLGYDLQMPNKSQHSLTVKFGDVGWSSTMSGQADFPLWIVANGDRIPFEHSVTFTKDADVVKLTLESNEGAKPYALLEGIRLE